MRVECAKMKSRLKSGQKKAKEKKIFSQLIKDVSSVSNFKDAALYSIFYGNVLEPFKLKTDFCWFNGFSERSAIAVVSEMRLRAR